MNDIEFALMMKKAVREAVREATAKNDKMSKQEYERRWTELNSSYRRGTMTTKEYYDKLDELKREYKMSNATAKNAADVKGKTVYHNGNAIKLTGEVISKHGAEWYVGRRIDDGKEVVVMKDKYDKAYGFNSTGKNAVKTKSASKMLQLMDKDYSYQEAIKKVVAEDGISKAQLEKECEPFI